MNGTTSTRTICCKVIVDATADTALRATQAAFNRAATYCASVAWEQGVTNKNKLHKLVYTATRMTFGLGAQLACCARDKAAEAVRAVRAAPERRDRHTNEVIPKTCPTFRDDGSIRYDANSYRLMRLDQVSLYTLNGRMIGQIELGPFQRRTLYDRSWKIGGAELIRRAGVCVVTVDAYQTSQRCRRCGHTEEANRITQAEFCCVVCQFASPADYKAAINSERAAVKQPMVSNPRPVRRVEAQAQRL